MASFDFIFTRFWLVVIAFGLDLFMGDRRFCWRHPVCCIGDLLNYIEPHARKLGENMSNMRFAGILSVVFVVLVVGFGVCILTSLPYVGWIFWFYLAYAGLSTKSLFASFDEALSKIESADLHDAQQEVAKLVSRDTTVLDRDELRKTLADSFTENFTDAIVAPLFWLIIGGPVGLWVYKAVSTMDSMWGYKTERWSMLGMACAKADDLMAYIPARLTPCFFHMANQYTNTSARTTGKWPGSKVIFAQASGMPSPNSGIPMASAAWLMNARLGGPSVYFGEMVEKPWLGPNEDVAKPWDKQRMQDLSDLTRTASYLAFGSMLVGYCVLLLLSNVVL